MESEAKNELVEFLNNWQKKEEFCDCDEKCSKCGKRKKVEPYPYYQPYYAPPTYPAWPQPSFPNITWTCNAHI